MTLTTKGHNVKTIKVTWNSVHGQTTSASFSLNSDQSDLAICEKIFRDTNLYQGEVWDIIEPLLSDQRSHTALSVDDFVEIDGTTFVCADIGFKPIS